MCNYCPYEPLVIGVSDAAHRLNVSAIVIYNLIRSGELDAMKIRGTWKINYQALRAYVEVKKVDQPCDE